MCVCVFDSISGVVAKNTTLNCLSNIRIEENTFLKVTDDNITNIMYNFYDVVSF